MKKRLALGAVLLVLCVGAVQVLTPVQIIDQAIALLAPIVGELTPEGQATHTRVMADLDAMRGQVAPEEPPPPSGDLTFPGQANWLTVWPDADPTTAKWDAPAPPSGWLSCDGYPERRAFVEGQWHFNDDGDLNNALHQHVGACLPGNWRDQAFAPEMVRGVIQLDVRVVAFHYQTEQTAFKALQASLNKLPSQCLMMPAPKGTAPGAFGDMITEHMQVWYVPVRIDTRCLANDGQKSLRLNVAFHATGTPDKQTHLTSLFWPISVSNGGKPVVHELADGATVSGWGTKWVTDPVRCASAPNFFCEINTWGYLNTSTLWGGSDLTWSVRMFADDVAQFWKVRINGGANAFPLGLSAFVNPDLHVHPPNYGTVLLNSIPVTSSSTTTPVGPPMNPGDRIVFRAEHAKPGNPHGAAATLLVVKLGPAK